MRAFKRLVAPEERAPKPSNTISTCQCSRGSVFAELVGGVLKADPAVTNATMASQQQASIVPWHAKYPAPEHQPGSLTREQLLELMKQVGDVAGADFLLVDLRRNDHEVSLNSVSAIYHLAIVTMALT